MRYQAFLLAASAFTSPAMAQTLSSPPASDAGTFTAVPVTYAAGTTPNVLGDGSNAKGGVAVAFTKYPELVDPSPNVPAGWLFSASGQYCTVVNTGGCPEKKMRTHGASAKFLNDDSIRYWGQPGVSHCHEFFGNLHVNARSTWKSLRINNESTAAGGPANATGYWEPCFQTKIAGKTYAIPANYNVIYYAEGVNLGDTIKDDLQPLHSRFRFISGVNPDDPDDAIPKAEIAAANAQPGTSGRYQYIGNGFTGYSCLLANGQTAEVDPAGRKYPTDPVHAKGFKLADGSDPFGGRCVDGSKIVTDGFAPSFWDCTNLTSPTGFQHVRHGVRDTVTGQVVGPNGWCKVPAFILKTLHQTHGFADHSKWELASDAHMRAKLVSLGTPRTVLPGESFHFDWMNGWNRGVLDGWLRFCMGIGTNVPHECNSSTVSETQGLVSGNSPDGKRKPQIDIGRQVDTYDPKQLHLVDTARPSHINMKGM